MSFRSSFRSSLSISSLISSSSLSLSSSSSSLSSLSSSLSTSTSRLLSDDGSKSSPNKDLEVSKEDTDKSYFPEGIPKLNFWDFLSFKKPWVLVSGGSYGGFFDFVPSKLRTGRWSRISSTYIIFLSILLVYTKPNIHEGIMEKTLSSPHYQHPEAFTIFWYCNSSLAIWTTYMLLDMYLNFGGSIFSCYTIQSWTLITLRNILSSILPFVAEESPLLIWNEALKFPMLVTSTITFFVWNFMLGPYIYFQAKQTSEEKREFLKWNFNIRMSNLHLFNIVFATLNGLVTGPKRLLIFADLWLGYACFIAYGLFYLLVLDRAGVHFYPMFSPRTRWSVLTWTFLVGFYFGNFLIWDEMLKSKWFTEGAANALCSALGQNLFNFVRGC